jgi:hypothetical protein
MKTDHLKFFEANLRGALMRESQGLFGNAAMRYELAILDLVIIAVTQYDNVSSGVGFLSQRNASLHLEKVFDLMRRTQDSEEMGVFNTLAVAHAASLLNKHELAEYLIRRVQYPGDHFWNEFADAMNCLVLKHPYEPQLGPLSGVDRYWGVYLTFISDITNSRDPSGSLECMRQSFLKANKDKRLSAGALFEPSGLHPVQWDFRAEALKACAAHKYSLAFPT